MNFAYGKRRVEHLMRRVLGTPLVITVWGGNDVPYSHLCSAVGEKCVSWLKADKNRKGRNIRFIARDWY